MFVKEVIEVYKCCLAKHQIVIVIIIITINNLVGWS